MLIYYRCDPSYHWFSRIRTDWNCLIALRLDGHFGKVLLRCLLCVGAVWYCNNLPRSSWIHTEFVARTCKVTILGMSWASLLSTAGHGLCQWEKSHIWRKSDIHRIHIKSVATHSYNLQSYFRYLVKQTWKPIVIKYGYITTPQFAFPIIYKPNITFPWYF